MVAAHKPYTKRTWARCKQDRARIKELLYKGKGVKEIALELGLTVEKVQSNVRYQFGWRRVLLSPEEQALIAERRAAKT